MAGYNDTLDGGDGNDYLEGGGGFKHSHRPAAGNDTLIGEGYLWGR